MKDEKAKEHLDQALLTSRFRLIEYIEEGYNLWKLKPISFIGILLLSGIASFIVSSIPFIGVLINYLIISPCLTAGIYLGTRNIDIESDEFQFEDFFSGFSFLSKVMVLQLIIFGFLILFGVALTFQIGVSNLELISSNDPTNFPVDAFSVTTLLLFLTLIYALLLSSYAMPMLAIYGLGSWDALLYSAKFIHKHWLMYFLFSIILIVLVLMGLILLIIGIVVTLSAIYPVTYVSFKDLTNLDGYLNNDRNEPEESTGASLDHFR